MQKTQRSFRDPLFTVVTPAVVAARISRLLDREILAQTNIFVPESHTRGRRHNVLYCRAVVQICIRIRPCGERPAI